MKHYFLILLSLVLATAVAAKPPGQVLIVADEFPAMEVLAKALKDQEGIHSTIVQQTEMPESLSSYQAVIVYIHRELLAGPEEAFINYTRQGGKLILLHHTLSSAKRSNAHWFGFLGFDILKKDVNEGGYKWIEGVDMQVVNLAPKHFITSNKVKYEAKFPYQREAAGRTKRLPGFALRDTEVYLNHVYHSPRTILLGFSYRDETGKVWMQDRSAWCMPSGKGWLFYAQPGHTAQDFENPVYARILVNAVIYRP
jgi:hypothetical protein